MSPLAGVRFRPAGRVYYFDAAKCPELAVGDWVVVETSRGAETGWVVLAPPQLADVTVDDAKPVVRRATWHDLSELARLRTQEQAALHQARKHIADRSLPMKAVKAEYNYDGSVLTIHFFTEAQRVDFRDLVRELARAFRCRVHLHQVGPRDWSKLIGGIERCGRELCCATWMADFAPISIRMAKRQNLPLNPAEISGTCGKLLCCLSFEDEHYKTLHGGLPRVGSILVTGEERGKVVDVNVLAGKVTVALESGARVTMDAAELADVKARQQLARAGSGAGTEAGGDEADTEEEGATGDVDEGESDWSDDASDEGEAEDEDA